MKKDWEKWKAEMLKLKENKDKLKAERKKKKWPQGGDRGWTQDRIYLEMCFHQLGKDILIQIKGYESTLIDSNPNQHFLCDLLLILCVYFSY